MRLLPLLAALLLAQATLAQRTIRSVIVSHPGLTHDNMNLAEIEIYNTAGAWARRGLLRRRLGLSLSIQHLPSRYTVTPTPPRDPTPLQA